VEIAYRTDTSTSRLHPVERVSSITYTPDQRRPFVEYLSMIPSAHTVCVNGCDLEGMNSSAGFGVYIYPSNPTSDQLRLADQVASDYASSASRFRNLPCITISFSEHPSISDHRLPKFNTLTVNELIFSPCDPSLYRADPFAVYKELKGVTLNLPVTE
jgi:hypothetical protein